MMKLIRLHEKVEYKINCHSSLISKKDKLKGRYILIYIQLHLNPTTKFIFKIVYRKGPACDHT